MPRAIVSTPLDVVRLPTRSWRRAAQAVKPRSQCPSPTLSAARCRLVLALLAVRPLCACSLPALRLMSAREIDGLLLTLVDRLRDDNENLGIYFSEVGTTLRYRHHVVVEKSGGLKRVVLAAEGRHLVWWERAPDNEPFVGLTEAGKAAALRLERREGSDGPKFEAAPAMAPAATSSFGKVCCGRVPGLSADVPRQSQLRQRLRSPLHRPSRLAASLLRVRCSIDFTRSHFRSRASEQVIHIRAITRARTCGSRCAALLLRHACSWYV